jgi:hypothetical protein
MALVAVPSNRLVLVDDAPAGKLHVPRLLLVGAGVPLPTSMRAVAAVNNRLGSVIVQAQATTRTRSPALLTHGLAPVLLGAAAYAASSVDSTPRIGNVLAHATRGSPLLIGGPGYAASSADSSRSHLAVTALGGRAASGGGGIDIVYPYNGYYDYSDGDGKEAKRHAVHLSRILRIRARLDVMIDKVLIHLFR